MFGTLQPEQNACRKMALRHRRFLNKTAARRYAKGAQYRWRRPQSNRFRFGLQHFGN
jgi:hypothetical protein